jgi:hypothetical protein
VDQSTVTVQPAGPAGERHVFLTVTNGVDNVTQQIEFVLSEEAARHLGDALISGSLGVMRKFDL